MQFKRLDFLSLKMDSYDKNLFTQDILSYSKNSMLFFYDFNCMHLEYKPAHVKWFPTTIKFPFPKNKNFYHYRSRYCWLQIFSMGVGVVVIIAFLMLMDLIAEKFRLPVHQDATSQFV